MDKKVVLITGASSGIGKSLAQEYAQTGEYNIAICARNKVALDKIASQYSDCEFLTDSIDVSDESQCKSFVEKTIQKFHRIDVVINNAGISMRAIFEDVDLKVLHQLMDVNFWGTVYFSKYALPYLLETKGSLVGVISIAGYIGLPGRTGYSSSKFAMRGFLDTVRVENLKKGLHVLVAAPGFTDSNIRNVALTKDGSLQGSDPRTTTNMMTPELCAHKIRRAVDKRKRSLILTFYEGKLTVFLSKFFPSFVEKMSYKHMAKEPDSPFK